MSGNTFGQVFKVTTFGESHGLSLGCIIDGCPAGVHIDETFLQNEMARRRPGAKGASVTARSEADTAIIQSGVFEGLTTGAPLAIIIQNTNQHSGDYSNIKNVFRPGHADFTYTQKYGIRDYRGGGRASGRETCARVAAGAIAKLFLKEQGISITAYTERAAGISCTKFDASQIEQNTMRAPDADAAKLMEEKIAEIRKAGDSTGGIIACRIDGVPSGLGEPVFEKADALLAQAMLSIGAIKGIEFGCGFNCADMTGSQNNDVMRANSDKSVCFKTNNAGGILGGITNSDQIFFRCAVKPVPSIYQSQQTVDIHGNECDLLIEGRHDICLCPRIVPVIEAMAAITITDLLLRNRAAKA